MHEVGVLNPNSLGSSALMARGARSARTLVTPRHTMEEQTRQPAFCPHTTQDDSYLQSCSAVTCVLENHGAERQLE